MESVASLLAGNSFVIPGKQVRQIMKTLNRGMDQLLRQLLSIPKELARPLISGYKVGAAALGKSGAIYFGVNLEFLKSQIGQTVHGEQFAIANAFNHGEKGVAALAVSSEPCGHCRQWLAELARPLKIILSGRITSLTALLPRAFGPRNLGLKGGLFTPVHNRLRPGKTILVDPLPLAAYKAANRSYAPYSNSPSGVAIRTKEKKIYAGSYLENAAFNPSLPPLQAAITSLVCDRKSYDLIEEIFLVEKKGARVEQEAAAKDLLKKIAPRAGFRKGTAG